MRMIDDCRYWLVKAGIAMPDADQLRRISMTLHRWHELECGDGNGCIDRCDETGKPFWLNSRTGDMTAISDRERGALKRLAAIMARYPGFEDYVQGDPRGCALYILRPGDIPEGASMDSCYNRGIAVHK